MLPLEEKIESDRRFELQQTQRINAQRRIIDRHAAARKRRIRRRVALAGAIVLALFALAKIGLSVPAKADEETLAVQTVAVIPAAPVPSEPAPVYPLTSDERDLIAAVVWGEARGEGAAGMEAVAEVVLNRLLDWRFGATVAEVATVDQFHGLGQVEPEVPAYKAVDAVFWDGQAGKTNGALYFCRAETDPDAIKAGLVEVARVGRHIFYTDKEEPIT